MDELPSLSALFSPRAIAVIGATDRPRSVGQTTVMNLIDGLKSSSGGYQCEIYPVNPNRDICCGLKCYHDISLCPTVVDLAVIITPAKSTEIVMESCGKAGVSAAIVISAGFKEVGAAGAKLENDMLEVARKYNVRVVGPNCLGIIAPHNGVNATFAATNALAGSIAFISQSGAMCTAVLDWSLKEGIGFSAFVSLGSMADVGWGDLIDYFSTDDTTDSIFIYMETIGNAAHFLSAARNIVARKPIVVIKAGQTDAAAQAAASHTGSLAGSHDAFLAAMKRAGVLVVETIKELFDCALVLSKQKVPRGENLLIITNAGGPGVLATDATSLSGANVCKLEDGTIEALNQILPPAWSHGNPVDVLGDASSTLYAKTLEIAANDKNVDGLLVVLSPQSVTDCTGTAKCVIEARQKLLKEGITDKAIFCSWMGGNEVQEGFDLLNANSIPTFPHPDAAAKVYGMLWGQAKSVLSLAEKPQQGPSPVDFLSDKASSAIEIINAVRAEGRELLTEAESKQVLQCFSIPIADTVICRSEGDAVKSAEALGFPCVVKLNSKSITHKSDVGGVRLNQQTSDEVRQSWKVIQENVCKIGKEHFDGVTVQPMLNLSSGIELIFGSIIDDLFGPLILFGAGGCMVEIMKDRALGFPPLDPSLARKQIEATKIFKALEGGQGQRFPGVNLELLTSLLCRFSQMICDLGPYISECDINPVLASPDRIIALDARIVLKKPGVPGATLAIRPYPKEYVMTNVSLADNSTIAVIRPTFSNDVEKLVEFYTKLAKQTNKTTDDTLGFQELALKLARPDYARLIPMIAIDTANTILAIGVVTRLTGYRGKVSTDIDVLDIASEKLHPKLSECITIIVQKENWSVKARHN